MDKIKISNRASLTKFLLLPLASIRNLAFYFSIRNWVINWRRKSSYYLSACKSRFWNRISLLLKTNCSADNLKESIRATVSNKDTLNIFTLKRSAHKFDKYINRKVLDVASKIRKVNIQYTIVNYPNTDVSLYYNPIHSVNQNIKLCRILTPYKLYLFWHYLAAYKWLWNNGFCVIICT